MNRVLILGKNSYIGKRIELWLKRYSSEYEVKNVSVRDNGWKEVELSEYDTVVNLAGIAHINDIKADMQNLFYSVNRDLAIEICKCAKKSGVKHFIHFSSMNVYGDFCGIVNEQNNVNPTSFYGKSKLEGDNGILVLAEDNSFIVSIIRPPFVYGEGCKGNYNTVRKLSIRLPLFPTYKNKKSMIYIDNLCEFVRLCIAQRVGGILTPQNKEIVSTAELVREISAANNHKVFLTGIINWTIPLLKKISRSAKKAFADDSYTTELSNYFNYKYCVVSFSDSIRRTERE